MCTHNVYITKLRSSLWKRLSVSCFSIFFLFLSLSLTLSPSLLFPLFLSFFLCLSRAFFPSLSSHISFKSGCILHKLTRISARMIACDKNNEQEQTQWTRESMFVSLVSFSFSLFRCNFFRYIFFLSFLFLYSLSLLHVRAAMAAQSVILIITLLTMIIIIFFWNCLLIVID